MNEWSPGGNYSRPVTPNQQGQMRSLRPPWDDTPPERKPMVLNIRAVADSRNKPTFPPRSSLEDIPRGSLTSISRKKKSLTGTSDPRFKKVLSPNSQKDAGVSTELKSARIITSTTKEENVKSENADLKTNFQCGDVLNKDKFLKPDIKASEFKNLIVPQETLNFEPSLDPLKEVEKLSFNPDIVFPKKSASDCTIRTKNTSYGSDDIADEYLTRLHTFPSATRITKVHNWIKEQKPKPEKRRSVITVIGQTQAPPPLSSTLQEIDQRKKLAKELDKHAICKKLITTDKDKEISNLISKINFITAPAKITPGGDRMYGLSDFSYDCGNLNVKDYGGSGEKKPEWAGGMIDGAVNNDTSVRPQDSGMSSKRSSQRKHGAKKSSPAQIMNFRDKIGQHLDHLSAQWLVYFMVILSGALCWFTFFSIQQNNSLFHLDWFPIKPKTVTWYERLFNWIWEIFRPSGSYRRSTPWNAR